LSPGTTTPRAGEWSTPWWLVWASFAVLLPFLGKAPVLDEEGYLWVGRHLDLTRPYDWTRIWPPYADNAWSWAHPPLHLVWMKLWSWIEPGPLSRLVSGAPWIALLAASFARLSSRLCHHPSLAAGLWLASPVVVLGLHDTWMIDLQAVALATAAIAAYREGLIDEERAWFVASGVLLGLAIETKYPMAVLVPVLLVHMTRLGPRPALLGAMVGVVVLIEVPLALVYGEPHPWAVWTDRSAIEAGALVPRMLGTAARAGLLVAPLILLRTNPLYAGAGLAGAIALVLVARPAEMPIQMSVTLMLAAASGTALLFRAGAATISSPVRRRKGDRGDPLLFGGWFVAVFLGVVFAHNYASARYLLPAAAPAALLLTRSGEEVPWGKVILRVMIGLGAVTSLALAVADYRFAAATVEVARKSLAATAEVGAAPGRFAGEWGFRGELEAAGWSRYRPDEVLPAGTWVIVADNSSAGVVRLDRLEPIQRVESDDTFPIRVVDIGANVGLYAETLGVLPLGLGEGPLEAATLYQVREAP
jgi:4-amino-4-deoxy-L-arabinose transferase-like glycosyltransferase